jgi:hypothetical protein
VRHGGAHGGAQAGVSVVHAPRAQGARVGEAVAVAQRGQHQLRRAAGHAVDDPRRLRLLQQRLVAQLAQHRVPHRGRVGGKGGQDEPRVAPPRAARAPAAAAGMFAAAAAAPLRCGLLGVEEIRDAFRGAALQLQPLAAQPRRQFGRRVRQVPRQVPPPLLALLVQACIDCGPQLGVCAGRLQRGRHWR